MASCMKIIRGSSINADTVEIIIIQDDKIVFSKKYSYGYNASYEKSWETEKKPFIDDIIYNLNKKYNVISVQETEGKNIFKQSLENGSENSKSY